MSAISFMLYQQIMNDIAPIEIEDIDVTIKLANRDTISPVGIVSDVELLHGKIRYPSDFLVLGSAQDDFVPLYLVDLSSTPLMLRLIALKKLPVLTLVVCLMSLICLNTIDNLMI